MSPLRIVHLYATEMNIYGDNGNVQVLRRRLEWRGIDVEVSRVGVGDPLPVATATVTRDQAPMARIAASQAAML